MKVVLEGTTEGAAPTPFRKEFVIESVTDGRGCWILVDEDGEQRLMLSGDEFVEIAKGSEVTGR